jgi:hypothetical protein
MVSSIPVPWREFWSGYFWRVVGTMIDWQESNLWSVPLDWAGWAGHTAFFGVVLLSVAGWSRTALAVAIAGVVCAIARNWTLGMNSGFLAGYYVWIGSLATAGLSALPQLRRRRREWKNDEDV